MRKTKILATLGPASNDVAIIKKMIKNGMDAARINFSHSTHEAHEVLINKLKEAREAMGKPVPLILDTKGPEIRIKTFDSDKIYLEQGAEFTLTTRDIVGNKEIVAVTYSDLPHDLQVGSRVLIDDGLIELKVLSIVETDIKCVVVNAGFLASRKGVNIPDVYVNLPSITEQDINDIKFGIKMDFDYIAASFVRTANDVLNIRKVLEENGGEHIRIIAKIESRDGVNNLNSILEVADAIMVARGDLGVEIPPEEVPLVQKKMIAACNNIGKPVITATHMLESMCANPRPTRAEANDVANAIYDGTDVVMLSGETAGGQYPVEAVTMMARIAATAESAIDYTNNIHHNFNKNITNAISFAACATATDMDAACIVAITDSGFAARMVSRVRPSCPILAMTTYRSVYRQLSLVWGCLPFLYDEISSNEDVFDMAEKISMETGLAKPGETIVAIAGVPIGIAGTTNTIKVCTVGDVLIKGKSTSTARVQGISRVFKVQDKTENPYFDRGDIIFCTETSDHMLDFMKKAGAIVIGDWEKLDCSHAETVCRALDIPLMIASVKVVDAVKSGSPVTVDAAQGLVFNGFK